MPQPHEHIARVFSSPAIGPRQEAPSGLLFDEAAPRLREAEEGE